MTPPVITFGTALQGEIHEPLRHRLTALAVERAGPPLHVDTVLAVASRVPGEAADAFPSPRAYLLMDLHRILYYEEPLDGSAAARIASVVRFVVDDYPFKPYKLLDKHFRTSTPPFLYDPAVLDILPSLWRIPAYGTVTILNMATGEISRAAAHEHPDTRPIHRVDAAGAGPPEMLVGLRERWTDASLRTGTPIDLEGLVSPVVGPVRDCAHHANTASLPYATARVAWGQGQRGDVCGGRTIRGGDAGFVATCEALERFQIAFQRRDEVLVRASRAELGGLAIDPRRLFFDAGGNIPSFYDDETVLHWTWASDPMGGDPMLVPAQDIWFNAAETLGEAYHVRATTSGCALGASVEEAAVFAIFEAVERDAFLTSWYLRRRCARINPGSIRHEGFQLLRRRWHAAYPGYSLFLFDMTNDIAMPTVMTVAVRDRGEGPRVFIAAATRLCAEQACFTALKDLTGFTPGMTPERLGELRRLLDEPERIDGPMQHFELYALDETFDRLGFLDFGPHAPVHADDLAARALIPPTEKYDLREVIRHLAEHLHTLDTALYLKDLSHPAIAARGVRCVKAVTPGLLPIWFGSQRKRVAVTERLKRLALDFCGREISTLSDLNLDVHPFS